MNKPCIIAINSISGGGKTALTRLLNESLPNSAGFYFDDFDTTNQYPEDFYQWWKRGADLCEFDCPGMRNAVDGEIERGAAEYIVIDYPFGRDHPRFQTLIDLSVYIDTPLDVAMARRVIRDHGALIGETADDTVTRLRKEMAYYLEMGRFVYLNTDRHKITADLVLDGCSTLQDLTNQILEVIRVRTIANQFIK